MPVKEEEYRIKECWKMNCKCSVDGMPMCMRMKLWRSKPGVVK